MSKPITEVRIAEVPGGTSLIEFTFAHGIAIVPVSEIRPNQSVILAIPAEPAPEPVAEPSKASSNSAPVPSKRK